MSSSSNSSSEIAKRASEWLAKRDRLLDAAEQDAYLQWLSESPFHGEAIAHLEKTWRALDQLKQWRPEHSPQPNPDLLAPKRTVARAWRVWPVAIAAVLAVAFVSFQRARPSTDAVGQHHAILHPGPERMALEDGSIVELNAGAKISVRFTPGERQVILERGEAHFTVAKNPSRPFIVSADKFAVRAIGTAFSVQLDQKAVSVLVTEGKVRLDETQLAPAGQPAPAPRELSHLIAGQQVVVSTMAPEFTQGVTPMRIREVTPAEIERVLSWQGLRLEFVEMPLRDVAVEFNRYNQRKLVIGDDATGSILVQGKFRADNVDAFVRLLDLSFGVTSTTRENEIVLKRTR